MISKFQIPVWKTSPFLRLLLPFIIGIIAQWYLKIYYLQAFLALCLGIIFYVIIAVLPMALHYQLKYLQGILINIFLVCLGILTTWNANIQHAKSWYGNVYKDSNYIVVTINENLVQKTKAFKAEGNVKYVLQNNIPAYCTGKLLIYFTKDTIKNAVDSLVYGDQILIRKPLQSIKNSGNPGSFNYQRYAAFQHIYHQVFLAKKDWVLLPTKNINPFWKFIYFAKANILAILKNYFPDKNELGIAEALLIGYTNDLDKDLVQAYSNTGVVHIIAISGMHLGLIYGMLIWIFSKLPYVKKSKIIQVICILSCLWIFSLLTGASASVIRSAVMFTCVSIGTSFFKKSSIYNALAASAFVMLCYNPYYLWDVGFQLSYLAVVGIIIFQKSIYNWFYFKHKITNHIWELASITLAAQVLTFPICVYYFHQFPILFLLSNIIAVPLSSFILYGIIALLFLFKIPFIGYWLGWVCNKSIWFMNKYILWINDIPFAVVDKMPASVLSTWLLYAFVVFICSWLLTKNKNYLKLSLFSTLFFCMQYAYNRWQIIHQQKIIVYNVPHYQAIDFVKGNKNYFIGDTDLMQAGILQNFHLKPARILMQTSTNNFDEKILFQQNSFYAFGGKTILLIDKPIKYIPLTTKINVDFIIFSKNPKLYIPQLAKVFNCKQYIFDASNSLWKIDKWKSSCDELHLPYYSIPDKGAFVFDCKQSL